MAKISPLLSVLLVSTCIMYHPCSNPISSLQQLLTFERQEMSYDADSHCRVEGYWACADDFRLWPCSEKTPCARCKNFPYPAPHQKPWPTQKEFLEKLYRLEALAEKEIFFDLSKPLKPLYVTYFKGMSPSRLEKGQLVGCAEFFDPHEHIKWPAGFSWYYVARFNVKPSQEFYEYVMNHPLVQ